MALSDLDPAQINIRPLQYRDLEVILSWTQSTTEVPELGSDTGTSCSRRGQTQELSDFLSKETNLFRQLEYARSWYAAIKLLSWFPNPYQHNLRVYVAQARSNPQSILGLIQVSPFNYARSTWKVNQIVVNPTLATAPLTGKQSVGSLLLRHCLEQIWEARTWILEVEINQKSTLSLYRENGFQPLAQMTYWAIAPDLLAQLADSEPDLPNLLPVSNADAQLLYQLDCVSMPPILRQVFDRHTTDFKTSFICSTINQLQQWWHKFELIKGYVFEPQRKAAIGYFAIDLCKDGSRPHQAKLTVHPAYTWLYPKLLVQMAAGALKYPSQTLELASADYQPEREEYLDKLGAQPIERTLLMSRSVWHKLKEAKPLESLQLSEVLQGLQPARRPIPTRMSFNSNHHLPTNPSTGEPTKPNNSSSDKSTDAAD